METRRHVVAIEDLESFVEEEWVNFAASFGRKTNKSLDVDLVGHYRVMDHGKVVYRGGDTKAAVEAYNSLP